VIKVIWGSYWDPLIARDKEGRLLRVMDRPSMASTRTTRRTTARSCARISSGKDPKVLEMVARMSDEDICGLNRGGHDPHKSTLRTRPR